MVPSSSLGQLWMDRAQCVFHPGTRAGCFLSSLNFQLAACEGIRSFESILRGLLSCSLFSLQAECALADQLWAEGFICAPCPPKKSCDMTVNLQYYVCFLRACVLVFHQHTVPPPTPCSPAHGRGFCARATRGEQRDREGAREEQKSYGPPDLVGFFQK